MEFNRCSSSQKLGYDVVLQPTKQPSTIPVSFPATAVLERSVDDCISQNEMWKIWAEYIGWRKAKVLGGFSTSPTIIPKSARDNFRISETEKSNNQPQPTIAEQVRHQQQLSAVVIGSAGSISCTLTPTELSDQLMSKACSSCSGSDAVTEEIPSETCAFDSVQQPHGPPSAVAGGYEQNSDCNLP